MFQVLISGALIPVDLDDLRRNTNYSGRALYCRIRLILMLLLTVVAVPVLATRDLYILERVRLRIRDLTFTLCARRT